MVERLAARKKQKKSVVFKFKNLAILSLLVYAVVVLVSQQVAIAEKKKENQKIRSQIVSAQQTQDETSRLLSMFEKDPKKAMEQMAIERLGYADKNETRIFDASKN